MFIQWIMSPYTLAGVMIGLKTTGESTKTVQENINGLVQDCSISIADTLEILQSCSKPSIYGQLVWHIENCPLHENLQPISLDFQPWFNTLTLSPMATIL